MNVIRYSDKDYQRQLRKLTSLSSLFDPTIEERTRAIVEAVYLRGDAALLEFTERFDGAKLTAQQLAVTCAEQLNASLKADDEFRAAVALTSRNVEMFSRKSIRKNWSARNRQGAKVGESMIRFSVSGSTSPGAVRHWCRPR
jgi:histidinol dehydrogenase